MGAGDFEAEREVNRGFIHSKSKFFLLPFLKTVRSRTYCSTRTRVRTPHPRRSFSNDPHLSILSRPKLPLQSLPDPQPQNHFLPPLQHSILFLRKLFLGLLFLQIRYCFSESRGMFRGDDDSSKSWSCATLTEFESDLFGTLPSLLVSAATRTGGRRENERGRTIASA